MTLRSRSRARASCSGGAAFTFTRPRRPLPRPRPRWPRAAPLGSRSSLSAPTGWPRWSPTLPPGMGGAAFFPGATFLDDPGRMMGLIAAAVLGKARLVRARADRLTRGPDGVVIEGPGPAPARPPRGDRRRGAFARPCAAGRGPGAAGYRTRLPRRMGHGGTAVCRAPPARPRAASTSARWPGGCASPERWSLAA